MLYTRRAVSKLAGNCRRSSHLSVGSDGSATTARTYCDPNYDATSAGCVPGDRDYDCPELHAMGIGDIPVIGSDWQRLDGYQDLSTGEWLSYPDGLGCEWYGE